MRPLKKDPENSNQAASAGAGALAESGVHPISPEERDAVNKAIAAKLANTNSQAENAGESYRRSVRVSTEEVCPKALEMHLPLVHQVVAPIARRVPANVCRDDLVVAGISGLADSLRKNGGAGGVAFEWYARTRIRGAILDELRAQDRLSRRARDAVNAAADQNEASNDDVIYVGLDELSSEERESFLVAVGKNPEEACEAKEIMTILVNALESLDARERIVVGTHYFEDKTFRDIGVELQISETRAFQLHGRAIGKLRHFFEKRDRRPFLTNGCRDVPELEPTPLPAPSEPSRSEVIQDVWTVAYGEGDPPRDDA